MKAFKQCLYVVVFIPALLFGQPSPTDSYYFSKIRPLLLGKQAYDVTGYVEKYFRLAGNNGFDKSIRLVESHLQRAGFQLEGNAKPTDRLVYRVEKRSMEQLAWEPIEAELKIEGESAPLLKFSSNRNMVAINSHSTPATGIVADVMMISDIKQLDDSPVKGKLVFAEGVRLEALFEEAVVKGGAAGLLVYQMPSYTKPEINTNSIQFSYLPQNMNVKSFCILLSFKAKENLKRAIAKGKARVRARVETKFFSSEELTIVAEARGSIKPDERFVFSAHVNEPGANDNASGVGCLTEMAAVTARLINTGQIDPKRTITFLWGDEIRSTRRFITEDSLRTQSILWGMSLDMVGENTQKTGGSFLIEKMPDPSAIWTRGKDKHSEWGGKVLPESALFPHFFNDFVINRFSDQGSFAKWEVNTNPFEGGSDHTPFIEARIPGILAWHFTDMFYHTDADRLQNVSQQTLKNVGVGALSIALTLSSADEGVAKVVLGEIEIAGMKRLKDEFEISQQRMKSGEGKREEVRIIRTWGNWYIDAIQTIITIPTGETVALSSLIEESVKRIDNQTQEYCRLLSLF